MQTLWASVVFVVLIAAVALFYISRPAAIDSYRDNNPKLDLQQFFSGPLVAEGVLLSRNGSLKRSFTATIDGEWKDNHGVLNEDFLFSDGEKQKRVWRIDIDQHHVVATAGDVVGRAEGMQFGNALNLKYVLRVPVSDKEMNISMDDWMYRVSDNTIVNHTTMRKWGIKVGELMIAITRKS